MSTDLFQAIVTQLKEDNIFLSSIHTIGEPLLNSNLAEYLTILRRHKMKLGILSSNCMLLDKHIDTIFEFSDVLLSLRPSIDASSKEVYERIRTNANWERLHRGLAAFSDRNRTRRKKIPVFVNSIISTDNFHELAFIPYVFSYLAPAHNFGFHFINSLSPSNDYFLTKNYFGSQYAHNMPCHEIEHGLYVLPDGNITVCCRDYHNDLVIGHVNSTRLKDTYCCRERRQLRRAASQGHLSDLPDICQECYAVDPRLSELINFVFKYFFLRIGKHPIYLQIALNRIGTLLRNRDFAGVEQVVHAL